MDPSPPSGDGVPPGGGGRAVTARELEEHSRAQYVPAAVLADVWAALGDRDRTIAALRLACQEKEGAWGRFPKVDSIYDGIRSDPRFGDVLDCMQLR
jgi:hypothetical protein